MIGRLQRALEQIEALSPEMQEKLAEQIEQLTRSDIASSMSMSSAPLGTQLAALRRQIVDSGAPLLSWEDVEAEVAERRS